MIFLAKNYNYIFEFVTIMPKVLSIPIFLDTVYSQYLYSITYTTTFRR